MTIEKIEKVICKNDFVFDLNNGLISSEGNGIKIYKGEMFNLYEIDFNGVDMLYNERTAFYFKRRDIKFLFEGVEA